jgi:hypothetical protein
MNLRPKEEGPVLPRTVPGHRSVRRRGRPSDGDRRLGRRARRAPHLLPHLPRAPLFVVMAPRTPGRNGNGENFLPTATRPAAN